MKTLWISLFLLAATCARANLTVSQTFSPNLTIPDGNPVGVMAAGTFTHANIGDAVLGITVDLNITGGLNSSLAAYLVGPNGTVVTLMYQPGVGVDGFGTMSSGMNNVRLSDAGSTSIQSLTGATGTSGGDFTPLTGTYQAAQTLGTFGNSSANGTWDIYFAELQSGGGDAVLNSFTLNITVVPEPVTASLLVFLGLVVLHWCLGWFWGRKAVQRNQTETRTGPE